MVRKTTEKELDKLLPLRDYRWTIVHIGQDDPDCLERIARSQVKNMCQEGLPRSGLIYFERQENGQYLIRTYESRS